MLFLFKTILNLQDEFNGSIYCHDDTETTTLQKALMTTKKVPYDHYKIVLLTCMTDKSFEALKPVLHCRTHRDSVYWLPWYCAREMEVQ